MPIERKIKAQEQKRQPGTLVEKHKKIGELLSLKKVPLHTLAWKEPRLELDTGECYPVVDVLERLAEYVNFLDEPGGNKKPAKAKKGK